LIAAALVTLSTTALDYSQDLRPYALTMFLVALAVYSLVKCALPGGSWGWWLVFAASGVAAVYNTYTALVMAVPSLGICALWAWTRWNARAREAGMPRWRRMFYPLAALALFGAALVPAALDVAKIPGSSVNLALLTPFSVTTAAYDFWTWLTRFGLPYQAELPARTTMLLLVVVGAYAGLRSARVGRVPMFAVWLPLLMISLPVAELVALSASKPTSPRYILFMLPFYCLLIANAVWALSSGIYGLLRRRTQAAELERGAGYRSAVRLPSIAALAVGLPALLLFAFGAVNYHTPQGYARLADRVDFRPVVALLNREAEANDTIIIADNPSQNLNVANFYWKDAPPAPVYHALDPRLFARRTGGDIYWAVATWDMAYYQSALLSDSRWTPLYSDGRLVLLKEKLPQLGMAGSIEYMSERLNALSPNRLALALRGAVYQEQGDLEAAAEAYTRSGKTVANNLRSEFMRTGEGFAGIGDLDKAWREVMHAKLEDAGHPEVHRWLAAQLGAQGYTELSSREEALARLLDERE
jgi:hypothetical protein